MKIYETNGYTKYTYENYYEYHKFPDIEYWFDIKNKRNITNFIVYDFDKTPRTKIKHFAIRELSDEIVEKIINNTISVEELKKIKLNPNKPNLFEGDETCLKSYFRKQKIEKIFNRNNGIV